MPDMIIAMNEISHLSVLVLNLDETESIMGLN